MRPLATLVFLALVPATAFAHSVGVSRGDYTVNGSTVEAELSFARAELTGAFPGLDADEDGALAAAELEAAKAVLEEKLVGRIRVSTASTACPGALRDVALAEQDGATVRATFRCVDAGAAPWPLVIELGFMGALSHGHRHLATATAGAALAHAVAYGERSLLELEVPAGAAGVAADASGWDIAGSLLVLGVEHIVTGYDHLLFLFALILVGGRLRSLLVIVTAFTVAHSITLGLSAFDVYSPSPSFVEPVIALSIAYVAVENWFVKDAGRRWMITFPFGLVHGFGFAGALREVALPSAQVPIALAAFNLGVELGQIAVLAVVLPLVLYLRKQPWFSDRGVKVASALIAAAGLYWFITRIIA